MRLKLNRFAGAGLGVGSGHVDFFPEDSGQSMRYLNLGGDLIGVS